MRSAPRVQLTALPAELLPYVRRNHHTGDVSTVSLRCWSFYGSGRPHIRACAGTLDRGQTAQEVRVALHSKDHEPCLGGFGTADSPLAPVRIRGRQQNKSHTQRQHCIGVFQSKEGRRASGRHSPFQRPRSLPNGSRPSFQSRKPSLDHSDLIFGCETCETFEILCWLQERMHRPHDRIGRIIDRDTSCCPRSSQPGVRGSQLHLAHPSEPNVSSRVAGSVASSHSR